LVLLKRMIYARANDKAGSRLTRYERKLSQPPIHSYEPKTFSHQPSQALYHPFDHLIMVPNGMM
jgi:hypothetical protein